MVNFLKSNMMKGVVHTVDDGTSKQVQEAVVKDVTILNLLFMISNKKLFS